MADDGPTQCSGLPVCRFELRVGDREVPSRAESLLALLLVRDPAAISRREAASLLWPESSEAQACAGDGSGGPRT